MKSSEDIFTSFNGAALCCHDSSPRAGQLLSQVVCAALVFISGPQKDTQESGSEGCSVV